MFKIKKGDYLLSHTSSYAVPLAFRSLTYQSGIGRNVKPWL